MKTRTKQFYFKVGGSVGFTAKVAATSKREAVKLLKAHLPASANMPLYSNDCIEYVEVYFNPEAITTKDICEDT